MAKAPGLMIEREQASLRQMVVDRIRENILFGTLEAGQKLVERDLGESLGVSRTLLREALQQLQAEGLITNVLHRGPSVAIISEQDARDIYHVRQVLEAEAGRGFARNASTEQMDQLANDVAVLHEPTVQATPHALLLAKNRFYETLLEGCGNKVIKQVLTQLNNRTTILRRMSLSQPGRLQETIIELEEIVAAARRRDEDEVARLCAAHVARAASFAIGKARTAEHDEATAS
jgi:DNA-binding GntR family transcriptional regulator